MHDDHPECVHIECACMFVNVWLSVCLYEMITLYVIL